MDVVLIGLKPLCIPIDKSVSLSCALNSVDLGEDRPQLLAGFSLGIGSQPAHTFSLKMIQTPLNYHFWPDQRHGSSNGAFTISGIINQIMYLAIIDPFFGYLFKPVVFETIKGKGTVTGELPQSPDGIALDNPQPKPTSAPNNPVESNFPNKDVLTLPTKEPLFEQGCFAITDNILTSTSGTAFLCINNPLKVQPVELLILKFLYFRAVLASLTGFLLVYVPTFFQYYARNDER
jgi:hypothetical protein